MHPELKNSRRGKLCSKRNVYFTDLHLYACSSVTTVQLRERYCSEYHTHLRYWNSSLKRTTLIAGYYHSYLQAGNTSYIISKFFFFATFCTEKLSAFYVHGHKFVQQMYKRRHSIFTGHIKLSSI